ncbi:hypothetical protein [Micromonospora sp. 15K316]|uniref:hypothetical protein n=1 Tax=Micromonospora sp. 15K316 TaxID=2530376 RepID=UPI0014053FE3|nr:hypothetical protein [Micromonospora sp. 15K316]
MNGHARTSWYRRQQTKAKELPGAPHPHDGVGGRDLFERDGESGVVADVRVER